MLRHDKFLHISSKSHARINSEPSYWSRNILVFELCAHILVLHTTLVCYFFLFVRPRVYCYIDWKFLLCRTTGFLLVRIALCSLTTCRATSWHYRLRYWFLDGLLHSWHRTHGHSWEQKSPLHYIRSSTHCRSVLVHPHTVLLLYL